MNGLPCYISYASPTQINMVVPGSLPEGNLNLEITTDRGIVSQQVTGASSAAALFTFALGGEAYAAAVHTDGVLVSPGHGARPGELIELFGTGLGAPADPYPEGLLFTRDYPLHDLQSVQVTIGGQSAQVLYAGLVSPGLFQINVRVPDGAPAGDQAVVLSVGGQSDESSTFLPVQP